MRYGFAFNADKSASGMQLSNNGLCVTYSRQDVCGRVAVTNEVMRAPATFLWRMKIKKLMPRTPMMLGVVDSTLWMPGQSLTALPGAIVIDMHDLSLFVHGEQQRMFTRQEKVRMSEGSFVDFYLDCPNKKLYISLDEKTAKEVPDIHPFPESLIAAAELYAEGDSVELEFPWPKAALVSCESDEPVTPQPDHFVDAAAAGVAAPLPQRAMAQSSDDYDDEKPPMVAFS
jgi:hypothetical protein